jgi:hypothetical protein
LAAQNAAAGDVCLFTFAHGARTNPKVHVLARVSYLRDVGALKAAGADTVYSGEVEVALAFVEDILETLGATPEQIDRERARAHRRTVAWVSLVTVPVALRLGWRYQNRRTRRTNCF